MNHCPVHDPFHPYCPACIEANRTQNAATVAPIPAAALPDAGVDVSQQDEPEHPE